MDKETARKLIKETFQNPFNKEYFIFFVKNLFNHIKIEDKHPYIGNYIPDAYKPFIGTLQRVAEYVDSEDKKIDVLIVKLKKETSLERARTMQRNFIAWYLNGSRGEVLKDAALVAFVSPDSEDWRFSLVKMDYHIESSKEKVKVKQELTPARRFSFLVGKNESSHTAQSQLLDILEDDENNPTLVQIEEAFSVERVTKEFYKEYKRLFDKICEELNKDRVFQIIKETKRIDTENFAKKLLGQIVFLYFIQKKGWLGVPRDKKWGEGDRFFLKTIFNKCEQERNNFFNDYLERLFYETLNKKPDLPGSFYRKYFDSQIPFLNGGLFEPMKHYDWENTFLSLDDNLFSNSETTGILDVFDKYNFTVKEDEPLEKEVAVDPEMLGKVFENLLGEHLRKGKGTYYTPREIVHYMCQESLINYLTTESGVVEKNIRDFITKFEFTYKKGNEPIKDNAQKLEKLLKEIKLVDPACGSGAFLVGMLQEVVRAREIIELFLYGERKQSEYQLKKETIQNCIYGVDIDPGAVEIAKLRLWLSLVVDYELEEIEPLPNLDYKVMQGNSLLEELVLGDTTIKLFDPNLLMKKGKKMKNLFEEEKQKDLFELQLQTNKIIEQLDKLRKKYFKISDLSEKLELKKQIEDIEQNLVEQCVNKEIKRLNIQLKNIGQYIAPGVGLTHKDAEKMSKTISVQAEIMRMWREFRESGIRSFFLWHLYFADVFQDKGGFDVVIANPPYLNSKNIDDNLKPYYEKNYQTPKAHYDIYIIFFEKGLNLLKNNGILTYITSNKYFSQKYGDKLREMLLNNVLLKIINFNFKVFEATVDTAITMVKKQKTGDNQIIKIFDISEDDFKNKANENMDLLFKEENFSEIKQNFFKKLPEPYFRLDIRDEDIKIFNKISAGTIRLSDLCLVIYGLVIHNAEKGVKKSDFVYSSKKDRYKLYTEGKYITRWCVKKYLYLDYSPEIHREPRYSELFENKKLIGKRIIGRKGFSFLFDENNTYVDNTLYLILPYHILPSGKYQQLKNVLTNDKITLSKQFNIKFILALINSVLFKWIFQKFYSFGIDVYPVHLKTFPIKRTYPDQQKSFVNIVDRILIITKDKDYLQNETKQKKVKEYEHQIDKMVYKLYGLTPEEIKIMEDSK